MNENNVSSTGSPERLSSTDKVSQASAQVSAASDALVGSLLPLSGESPSKITAAGSSASVNTSVTNAAHSLESNRNETRRASLKAHTAASQGAETQSELATVDDTRAPPSVPKDSSSAVEAAALPKRKKGTRGLEERKAAAAAAKVTSERITDAVRSFVEKMDVEMVQLAEANGISVDRVHQMIGQTSTLRDKRKVSDWNVLLHVKSKELNDSE